MYSSRMRTGRSLTICLSQLRGGEGEGGWGYPQKNKKSKSKKKNLKKKLKKKKKKLGGSGPGEVPALGGVCLGGVSAPRGCLLQGGVSTPGGWGSALGGVCGSRPPWDHTPQDHTPGVCLRHTPPCEQNDKQV